MVSNTDAATATCPPCPTTEKPVTIRPHKNPISILSEVTQNSRYNCEHTCINPPIHLTTLTVDENHMRGKNFTGKGTIPNQPFLKCTKYFFRLVNRIQQTKV